MDHRFLFGFICFFVFNPADAGTTCSLTGDDTDCSCVVISENPTSTAVVYETSTTLTCRVEGLEGPEVQWTKDGLALGTDPDIPGHERYTMTNNAGNTLSGNYDLHIRNLQLEDEAEYECQVTICRSKSWRATLTILVPPYGPVILDEKENSEYHVNVDTDIDITCEAYNAKPVADVSWYLGNDQIPPGPMVTKEQYPSETDLYNSSATLHLTPKLEDDGTIYTCVMNNAALIAEEPNIIAAQKKDITVIVQVPPTGPIIENLDRSEGTITVKENEAKTITCQAINAKPLPAVTWRRENIKMSKDVEIEVSSPDEYGRQNVSAYLQLIGNVTDDNVKFTCVVMNDALEQPKSASFVLQVTTPIDPLILGLAIGGIVLFVLIIVLVIVLLIRRKKRKKKTKEELENIIHPTELPGEKLSQTNASSSSESTSTKSSIRKEVEFDLPSISYVAPIHGRMNQAYSDTSEEEESSLEEEDISKPDVAYITSGSSSSLETFEMVNPKLPEGDVFSLSSSMKRSQRGSPVDFYPEIDFTSIPNPVDTSWVYSHNDSLPQYVVHRPSAGMVTDV